MDKVHIVVIVMYAITWVGLAWIFYLGRRNRKLMRQIGTLDRAIVAPVLTIALEESVKLQSHYAGILNAYDGGERMQFSGAEEWLDRLKETGTIPEVRRG
jgi:hypothetical protein